MWAQYGDDHAGVCLVIDRLRMIDEVGHQLAAARDLEWYSSAVTYGDDFDPAAFTIMADAIDADGVETALRKHQARYRETLFFHKNRDWATEYEYRFVAQRPDPGYTFVRIDQSLVGIILGERVSDVYGPSIDSLTTRSGVAAAQLQWRNGEPALALPEWERPKWYERDA
jgi:hypothetical protein